jgi:hypothetical protein
MEEYRQEYLGKTALNAKTLIANITRLTISNVGSVEFIFAFSVMLLGKD